MTAFNIVRFRVKPGRDEEFLTAHRNRKFDFKGARRAAIVKTGPQTYCILGEWTNMAAIVAARPQMIGILDSFRDTLEDLGGDLGVTDPVSGDVVIELHAAKRKAATKSKARASAKKPRKTAKRVAAKKKKPAKKKGGARR